MIKKLITLFILLIIVSLNVATAYAGDICNNNVCSVADLNYDLEGDVLYRVEPEGKVRLYDKIAAISMDFDTLYYIRSINNRWVAGYFKVGLAESREFDIPGTYEKLYRFAGFNNIFYFLAIPVKRDIDGQSDENPLYVRFNPDRMESQSIKGVSDFLLIKGKSVILRKNILDYNGSEIPLSIAGSFRIVQLIDSRIALISGDEGTEIVDLLAGKSIYQYKDSFVPEIPGEYNVIIEFVDKIAETFADSESGGSIYYQILVDGVEENRTVTGNGELLKIFHSKLAPGRYHIIKPERWELDKIKGRYARMNNINQPDDLKIYIPENRIIKIRVEFDGIKYRIDQSVLYK